MTKAKIQRLQEISEKHFEDYLVENVLEYKKDYRVKSGEIDFLVQQKDVKVYCDVKALLQTVDELTSRKVAIKRLRRDILKLKEKFKKFKPEFPCVLVSMNFSKDTITGFTVVRAMYGEADFGFNKETFELTKLHHMSKGNAAMTKHHNTSISGILCFNFNPMAENYFFHNEFVEIPLPPKFFPRTIDVIAKRESLREDLGKLGMIFISEYIERY